MKKVAFITHSFHEKTKSAGIYIEEIFNNKQKYEVDIFYNYEWGSPDEFKKFNTNIEGYDVVIILQLISLNLLEHIKDENIVFMPMYDYAKNFNIEKWILAQGLKILSPTKGMSQILNDLGLDYCEIKYFPEPDEYNVPNFKNVFFWNRVEEISYKIVLKLLQNYDFEKLNIHKSIDPGQNPTIPSKKEINEFNITFSEWFESKQSFLDFMSNYGIYIASRPYEGGGASFMDALKKGYVVIAPNNSPYSDYIVHNRSGFLYDLTNPIPLNLNDVDLKLVSINAYKEIELGRVEWLNSINLIHEYIFNQNVNNNQLKFKKNVLKTYENKWYRFGSLTYKNKIKAIFNYFKKKVLNKK